MKNAKEKEKETCNQGLLFLPKSTQAERQSKYIMIIMEVIKNKDGMEYGVKTQPFTFSL